MKITAQEEYGLRCLVAVARAQQGERPVAMSAIAKAEGMSTQYVAKLMNILKRHGLVVSVRGLSGGFKLARTTTQIAVIDVLQALGGGFEFGSAQLCSHFPGKHTACVHLGGCSVRPMWMMIQRHITEFLQHLTIQDLLDEEAGASQRMEGYMKQITDKEQGHEHTLLPR